METPYSLHTGNCLDVLKNFEDNSIDSIVTDPPYGISLQLESLLAQQHAAKLQEIEARNSQYFEEEVDKLDRWADDMKLALEHDIKLLNNEIKVARKEAKTKVVLAEKLAAQKLIKSLEQQLHAKRKQLFDAQDEVDRQRTKLIDDIERQLQTSADRDTLFTIRWQLPQVSSY